MCESSDSTSKHIGSDITVAQSSINK